MAVPPGRVRLTDISIANIGVADKARVQSGKDGVQVIVCNEHGCEKLQAGTGPANYPSVAAAKKAVMRHNPKIKFDKEPVRPSPSMLPPSEKAG